MSMLWVISRKEKLPTSADKQNRWCNRILTRAAIKLRSHGNPAVPTSWVDADVNGFERSDKLMINYGMTICVSVEYLRKKLTNKNSNPRFFQNRKLTIFGQAHPCNRTNQSKPGANYATRTTSVETRAPKLWSATVFRPVSKPNTDRRVILLAEATFCSNVNGLPSFVRKWRKSWLAQGTELE